MHIHLFTSKEHIFTVIERIGLKYDVGKPQWKCNMNISVEVVE